MWFTSFWPWREWKIDVHVYICSLDRGWTYDNSINSRMLYHWATKDFGFEGTRTPNKLGVNEVLYHWATNPWNANSSRYGLQVKGLEPLYSAWKAEVLAIIRYLRCTPNEIRIRVASVKRKSPWPLDDGGIEQRRTEWHLCLCLQV